jgi:hypothetical protein
VAVPVRKIEQDQTQAATPGIRWAVAGADAKAVPSPAREMQSRLESALSAEVQPQEGRWSARRSLAFMGLASTALWVGIGFLIHAAVA